MYLFSLVVVFLVHKYLFEPQSAKQAFQNGSDIAGNKRLISLIYVTTLFGTVFLGQFLSPIVVQPLVEVASLHTTYGIGAGVLLLVTTGFAISVMVQRKKKWQLQRPEILYKLISGVYYPSKAA